MDKVTYVSRKTMDRYFDRFTKKLVRMSERQGILELRVERLYQFLGMDDAHIKLVLREREKKE